MAAKQAQNLPPQRWNGLYGVSPTVSGPKIPPKGGSALPADPPRPPVVKRK